LLFMSGIQSGKMTMEFRRTDIAEVAADAVEDMRPEAARKQITLTLSASTIPSVADPARISQLLANLISNALKFTPRGGSVRVEAGTEREVAVLTVTDTGTGIPAADLKSIFERFFRSKAATQQAIPGTGRGRPWPPPLPLSPPPDSPGPDRSHDEAGLAADCPGHDHADQPGDGVDEKHCREDRHMPG